MRCVTAPAIKRLRLRFRIAVEQSALGSGDGAHPQCVEDVRDNVRRPVAAAHMHAKAFDVLITAEVEFNADARKS